MTDSNLTSQNAGGGGGGGGTPLVDVSLPVDFNLPVVYDAGTTRTTLSGINHRFRLARFTPTDGMIARTAAGVASKLILEGIGMVVDATGTLTASTFLSRSGGPRLHRR